MRNSIEELFSEFIEKAVNEALENTSLEVDADNVKGLDEAVDNILDNSSTLENIIDKQIENHESDDIEVDAENVKGLEDEIDNRIDRVFNGYDLKELIDNRIEKFDYADKFSSFISEQIKNYFETNPQVIEEAMKKSFLNVVASFLNKIPIASPAS